MTAKRSGAGALSERIAAEKRGTADDGYGNPVPSQFEVQFECAARLTPLKGTETVMASRLGGVQPMIIRVRHSSNTRQIQPDWQLRDVRKGTVYQIKSVANVDERREYLDILAISGVAG
jgi:SPP1 family predicted phage head-tail adaptor